MPKAAIAIGICFILFGTPLIEAIGNTEENSDIISINYSFDEPVIKKVVVGKNEYDMIDMNGLSYGSNPGEPCLPAKGAYILLPQKTKVGKIIATPSEKVFLGSGYKIMPMGNSVPLSDTPQPPIPNKKIYNSKNPFPGKLFTKVGIYNFRGYEILVLMLHPVQYIPATGEIFYYKHITISVKTKEDNYINPLFRGLEKDKMEVIKKVDNPSVADTYTKKMRKSSLEEYDLLIITTDSLEGAFEDLKNYHDDHDIRTVIKTLTETGSSPEEIRDYIRNAYLNWNIDYVLLGGDDDVVPAKMLWVEGLDENVEPYSTFMPSDLYYACLDGTFNYDGDDKWGEPNDGDNGGDVDLMAEVWVGRACVGNIKEANNFIKKTLAYMGSRGDYLWKVCLAGEYLGDYGIASWGGNYLDQLINESDADGYTTVGIPSTKYTIDKLYDRDWSDNYWPKSEIIGRINDGVHIINHLGHSSYGYNMKMVNDDVESLTNENYCFIYSQGCMAGGFDNGDCIAEYLTVKTGHGAFAAIMNARYGFFWSFSTDGDSQRYNREFWDAVFGENILAIGKANQDSKEDNLYLIQRSMMRWCYYQLNLFGDPSVAFRISNAPNPPSTPSGPKRIKAGIEYTYITSTTDIDGDKVYYKWDWGDGNTSNWIGPFDSGEKAEASHVWAKRGIYRIRVKAKDTFGFESDWSEPLHLYTGYYHISIIEKITEWITQILKLYGY
ncbi:hypothetical protein B6U81_00660 [Thermoplasmatales archaeon ex4484_30]|nr:MAG: hypothetical protein B6U81_00660 [Thermoplasmatales archaeon ex4484_30]